MRIAQAMLLDTVRILNFDGSLLRQSQLLERFHPAVIDCAALGPSCRLWINEKNADRVRAVLAPGLRHTVTLTGSGDFHHITSLLLEQFAEPISIIVFDGHPDWDILPPRRGCGSWVSAALRQRNIQKVILLGACSDDLSAIALHTGNLGALADNRVELYPYAHAPTKNIFRRVPGNISLQTKTRGPLTDIYWQELRQVVLEKFILSLVRRLPTRQAYISIDKDCLTREHALTNWEAGGIGLDELLLMLKLLRENLDIIGADITGEYSAPVFAGRCKAFCSRLDHPRNYSARSTTDDMICHINQQTNLRLLDVLTGSRDPERLSFSLTF